MFFAIKRSIKQAYLHLKVKHIHISPSGNFDIHSKFDGMNSIGDDTWFSGHLGYGSYLGNNCNVNADVGKYCSIASHVNVLTGTHPADTFVSTSPVFYSLGKQNGSTYVTKQLFMEHLYFDSMNKVGIKIGNDVWIGFGATILGGVEIGDGAIISSHAFVNTNVPPYAIVGGIPSKILRYRFEDEYLQWLCKFKWWDKPEKWICENALLFTNIKSFYSKMKGN